MPDRKRKTIQVADPHPRCDHCGSRVSNAISRVKCSECGGLFCYECFYEYEDCPDCISG